MRTRQIFLIRNVPNASRDPHSLFLPMSGRSDLREVQLELPIKWNLDPFGDPNWCAQLHMWRMLDGPLEKFDVLRIPSLLDLCIEVATDWWLFHQNAGCYSPIVWGDMRAGVRAMKIAYLITTLKQQPQPCAKQMMLLSEMAASHAWYLLDERNFKFSNHSFSHLHGLMALRQVFDDSRGVLIENFVNVKLEALLDQQFGEQYVHREHSPEYHMYALSCLTRLMKSGWFQSPNVHFAFRQALATASWFITPSDSVAPVGDTNGDLRPSKALLAKAKQENGVFSAGGYVVVREAHESTRSNCYSYLLATAARYSDVHKHDDDLSVIWWEGGPLLIDPGKYAYKNDRWRKYVKSRRAHNVLEVELASPRRNRWTHYGSGVKTVSEEDWGVVIQLEAPLERGTIQRRTIIYVPGDLLLVTDYFWASQPRNFTQWFHLHPSVRLSRSAEEYLIFRPSDLPIRMRSVCSVPTTPHTYRGESEGDLQGWISQTYGKVSPCTSIGIKGFSNEAVLTTWFSVGENQTRVSLSPEGNVHLSSCDDLTSTRWICGPDGSWCQAKVEKGGS